MPSCVDAASSILPDIRLTDTWINQLSVVYSLFAQSELLPKKLLLNLEKEFFVFFFEL